MNRLIPQLDRRIWETLLVIVAVPFAFLGLTVLLYASPNPWIYLPASAYVIAVGFFHFTRVSARILRQRETDFHQTVRLVAGTLAMLAAAVEGFAIAYRQFGLLAGNEVTRDPLSCLYFSAITWTTVGYGDFVPTPASRSFAAVEALTGYIFMAFLTATCVHVMTVFRSEIRTVSGATLLGLATKK